MIRKFIIWGLFGVFAAVCIVWLGFLVFNASKSESLRWGAKKMRAEHALESKDTIYIGAAGAWKGIYGSVLNGINLAAENINTKGGVTGKKIKIIPKDDEMSMTKGMDVAQQFADDMRIVAVIGHPTSMVSLSTSVIYEYYGILMLSPLATNPALTNQGRMLVFRNIPSDEADGVALADYAASKGMKRIVIYYLQDDYARGLANIFERRCYELGITIADRLPYDANYRPTDFLADISLWKRQYSFDGILLAGFLPQAGEIISQIRKAEIKTPILSGGSLDSKRLIETAGAAADNTVVVSTFDPSSKLKEVEEFVKEYAAQYGEEPDRNAAQGYDSLMLIAHAIESANSSEPEKIADSLRNVKNWKGVTGSHTFNDRGDVTGKKLVVKKVIQGQFQTTD